MHIFSPHAPIEIAEADKRAEREIERFKREIEIAEADKRAEREIERFKRERAERLCSPKCF